ncbi:MAG TPA: hypothetical protein VKY73_00105, partial [Polyangiaceae bacterium]|nr:hypothetical protein [Polyangiaceae bacterium]
MGADAVFAAAFVVGLAGGTGAFDPFEEAPPPSAVLEPEILAAHWPAMGVGPAAVSATAGEDDDFFPFSPPADPFSASALDLRSMNEASAGLGGPIVAAGDALVRANTGMPIRFWGVNGTPHLFELSDEELRQTARRLAKVGVNLLRLHGPMWHEDDFSRVDPEKLARLHRLAAELKDNGIYLALSIYFPLWRKLRPEDGFAGYRGDQEPFALPFFNDAFERIQQGWWDAILSPENPHTGLPLARDPALAFVEILNEDSLLFWTFKPYETIPAEQMASLERGFGQFVARRYGDIERGLARYGSTVRGDHPSEGRVGFVGLWDVVNRPSTRGRDAAEFLTRTMREYFVRQRDHLRRTGYAGTIVCSNWVTADARVLGPLDKWANLVCDAMDRHGYYQGPHLGERASYMIAPGDRYRDASALRFDPDSLDRVEPSYALPIQDVRYNGKPSVISEIGWAAPNRFRAELPLIAASYAALQGTDALMFFALMDTGGQRIVTKFGIDDPAILGQFPAAALLYRRGDLSPSRPVAKFDLALADLFALRGGPFQAPQNLDELRKQGVPKGALLPRAAEGTLDPLAFLVGPVEVHIAETAARTQLRSLEGFVNRRERVVTSATSELAWDYGRGLLRLTAPRAEGAAGFLGRVGPIDLGVASLETRLDYGAFLLVSLDGEPLTRSRRMLLQVMSEVQNTGFATTPAGRLKRIVAV